MSERRLYDDYIGKSSSFDIFLAFSSVFVCYFVWYYNIVDNTVYRCRTIFAPFNNLEHVCSFSPALRREEVQLTIVENNNIKDVHELPLVLMDSLELTVEYGVGVHVNVVFFFDVTSKFFLIDLRKITTTKLDAQSLQQIKNKYCNRYSDSLALP